MDANTQSDPKAPVHLSRQQILDATARCFDEHGYDGTTIRRIASMLGCAVGSIYRYFKDKRDLLDATTQQQLEVVAKLTDDGASFEQTVRLYVQRAEAGPQMYRLMFWLVAVVKPGPRRRPPGLRFRSHYDAGSTGVAATGPRGAGVPAVVGRIIAGWSRRLGDATLAEQCWASLHGSVMLGHGADQAVETTVALTKHHTDLHAPLLAKAAVDAPQAPAQAAGFSQVPDAVRPPAPGVGSEAHAEGVASQSTPLDKPADEGSDDVCLL